MNPNRTQLMTFKNKQEAELWSHVYAAQQRRGNGDYYSAIAADVSVVSFRKRHTAPIQDGVYR